MTSKLPPSSLKLAAAFLLAALTGCVPRVETPAPPAPTPTPTPRPAPAPPPPPPIENWMDAPQSAGDWYYVPQPSVTYAIFGASPQSASFILRCDGASRTISLERASDRAAAQTFTIRTETAAARQLPAVPRVDRGQRVLAADLPSSDSLLDAMAISKGRFAVETAGSPALYVPSWPEVTRVIEDCR